MGITSNTPRKPNLSIIWGYSTINIAAGGTVTTGRKNAVAENGTVSLVTAPYFAQWPGSVVGIGVSTNDNAVPTNLTFTPTINDTPLGFSVSTNGSSAFLTNTAPYGTYNFVANDKIAVRFQSDSGVAYNLSPVLEVCIWVDWDS